MANKQKIKGSRWENDAVDILNKGVKRGSFKRIAGSGMLGTILGEPLLTSDIMGTVPSLPKRLKIEAKVGYNSSKAVGVKQFTLKKEWLDKVAEEAAASYGMPMLVGKFLGAREGVKSFVVMDMEVFMELVNRTTELFEELVEIDNGKGK
jgi:hypothetical protein